MLLDQLSLGHVTDGLLHYVRRIVDRKCDRYHIGVVTQYEFRECVERTLGYAMTDAQWAELRDDVGLEEDGLISYPKFLEQFSAT